MAKKMGETDFLSLSYAKQGKQRMALSLSICNKARCSGRSTHTKGQRNCIHPHPRSQGKTLYIRRARCGWPSQKPEGTHSLTTPCEKFASLPLPDVLWKICFPFSPWLRLHMKIVCLFIFVLLPNWCMHLWYLIQTVFPHFIFCKRATHWEHGCQLWVLGVSAKERQKQ